MLLFISKLFGACTTCGHYELDRGESPRIMADGSMQCGLRRLRLRDLPAIMKTAWHNARIQRFYDGQHAKEMAWKRAR
jgi:hypothetical protein